jgi:hypothetical protein
MYVHCLNTDLCAKESKEILLYYPLYRYVPILTLISRVSTSEIKAIDNFDDVKLRWASGDIPLEKPGANWRTQKVVGYMALDLELEADIQM